MQVIPTNIDKVDKIFHLADIHIRPFKRHAEYKQVFNKLYSSIKSRATKNSIIAVLGDTVHAKTEMSPELVSMLFDFFNNLGKICTTIVGPGNHDANLNNKNRLDAISPIINNIKAENVYYLKNNEVYKVGDLHFVNMSVFDDNYIGKKDVAHLSPKIAMFHGVVDKSVNKFGYHFRNEKISADIFDDYDIVLLGDIHKHQYITDKIAYPGSLIQQNHGEELDHGYIEWNLINNKSEFVVIPNEYGYYTLEIKNGIIPNVTNMPKKCRLRIIAYDVPTSEITNIMYDIKKKYNPTEVTINRVNSLKSNSDTSIEIPNITDISYQNQLIEEYVSKNYPIDSDIINIIKDINKEINSEVEFDDNIKNVRWSPIDFTWENMFSYGENNYVDFTDMKGVVGLFAQNTAGKSAFVDAMSFCLFDRASKDFKPINIMNKQKNEFKCRFNFELSGKNYFVERNVWKNKSGNPMYKVNFGFIDKDGKEISLNGENRWGTNKNINSYIGLFEDFALTTFSMQNKNSNYIDKGHSDRKDLLIQFMGLGLFDKLFEIASNKNKEINSSLKSLESENWDEKLIQSQNNIETYTEQYNLKISDIKGLDDELDVLEGEINELNGKIIKIDENLDISYLNQVKINLLNIIDKFTIDSQSNSENISELNSQLIENNNEIEIYTALNIDELYKEIENLEHDKSQVLNDINLLKLVIKGEEDKLEKLKELEYDPECNYCMNNIFVKDAIETKNKLQDNKTKLIDLEDKFNNYTEIINTKSHIKEQYETYIELLEKNSELEKQILKLNTELSKNENTINTNKSELEKVENKIKKYYYYEESIVSNNNIQLELSYKNKLKLGKLNTKKKLDEEKLNLFGKIKVEESNIIIYKDNIEKLHRLRIKSDSYKYYMDSIKRDGIPYDLISKIVPTLETEINNILNQIVDFSIVIDLDESKNINMYLVYDEDKYWVLELASGMEKFISSLAIRIALTNISQLPRPNFLIIDEGWGSLDAENLNSVSMLLDYLKTQFEFIILISHVDQIKEVADIMLELKKDDGFSSLRYPI